MDERRPGIERYQSFTPLQLNFELKRLFELLPDFSTFHLEPGEISVTQEPKQLTITTAAEDASVPVRERRKKSELSHFLRTGLQELLTYARTTRSFCDFLSTEFEEYIEWGMFKNPSSGIFSDLNRYTRLLEWDKPDSGGIFDPDQAKMVEGKAYRQETRYLLSTSLTEEELSYMEQEPRKTQEELGFPETKQAIRKRQVQEELIKRWRVEFIEKYGDEP